MSPALIRPLNLELSKPFTPFLIREAESMHIQSQLYPRSTGSGSSGGVQENTVIFIIVGVVCLFVILSGFYLVSRHAASKAAVSTPCSPPQHSPITDPPCPRRERAMSDYWKVWKAWRHTRNTEPPHTVQVPTVQISPAPSTPSLPPIAMSYPSLVTPRPSQNRRVTSLSVTTSFSHSHITQEALNDFRVSAYDLDGDLETEMLNSARDDWTGHPLVAGESYGEVGIEETLASQGDATHDHGSVQGLHAPGDYENSSACVKVKASDTDGVGEVVVEVSDKVAMEAIE